MARECRAPKKSDKKATYKSNVVTLGQAGPVEVLSATKDNRLLSIAGYIDKYRVVFSLDSGATASIISARVVRQYGLRTLSSDARIKIADNSVINVIGVTEELSVNIEGHTCNMSMLLMNHEDHDILLGQDWFKITGAGLFPAEGILRFPGVSLHLNADNGTGVVDTVGPQWQEEVMITEAMENVDADDIAADTDWEFEIKLNVGAGTDFDEAKVQGIKAEVLNIISPVTPRNKKDLGVCRIRAHEINTGDADPIFMFPYKKSKKRGSDYKKW